MRFQLSTFARARSSLGHSMPTGGPDCQRACARSGRVDAVRPDARPEGIEIRNPPPYLPIVNARPFELTSPNWFVRGATTTACR